MRCRVLKRTAAGACLLMVAFMVCSCGLGSSEEAENPEKTMEALYQLVVCQDISEITKLGIDQAEAQETLDEYRSSMTSAIQEEFKKADFSISQSQASDILDEISGSLKKLDHKVSLKKRDGKEATVEVSSQYIEYRDLFKKASDETVNELKSRHVEELSGAKDLLVENIKDSFQNAEASKDMHSLTFQLKCEKIKSGENKVYIFFPEDAEETGAQLMKLVTNK